MIPRSWRRTLTPSPNPRRVVRRRFRPVLEILEDRMAPAVLTVNSTADTAQATDPYLSLHEAIAIVNSPTLPTGLSSQILASDSSPIGITAGPDGNLWFTEFTGNKVSKITPAGAVTEFPIPTFSSFPYGITAGPDGNLWFVESFGNKVGQIAPAGAVTEFAIPTPNSFPLEITAGPDGNLWFTEANGNNVGQISPVGAVTEFAIPTSGSVPYGITAGSDGNLWFVENLGNKVGRVISGTLSGSAAVTVVAAAANHFALSAPSGVTAGAPFSVTLTTQDAYGNLVTGYTGTVHFTSGDPYGASLPADYTFQASDQGQHTFAGGATLYTAGTWDVTATDTQSGITGAAFVNVQAAPAVAFRIVGPANATSGVPFDVTVMAVDAYGNTDTNYTGTVTFSTSDDDPGVVLPPDYTFQPSDAGMATFPDGVTLITLGDQAMTAIDTDSGIAGSATVTVIAGGGASGGRGSRANPPAALLDWPATPAAVSGTPLSSDDQAGTASRSAASTERERFPFRA